MCIIISRFCKHHFVDFFLKKIASRIVWNNFRHISNVGTFGYVVLWQYLKVIYTSLVWRNMISNIHFCPFQRWYRELSYEMSIGSRLLCNAISQQVCDKSEFVKKNFLLLVIKGSLTGNYDAVPRRHFRYFSKSCYNCNIKKHKFFDPFFLSFGGL